MYLRHSAKLGGAPQARDLFERSGRNARRIFAVESVAPPSRNQGSCPRSLHLSNWWGRSSPTFQTCSAYPYRATVGAVSPLDTSGATSRRAMPSWYADSVACALPPLLLDSADDPPRGRVNWSLSCARPPVPQDAATEHDARLTPFPLSRCEVYARAGDA